MARLQVNSQPFEYRIDMDSRKLVALLEEAMTPPGKVLVLPLLGPDGEKDGTLILNGAEVGEVVVDGVPPMDEPRPGPKPDPDPDPDN